MAVTAALVLLVIVAGPRFHRQFASSATHTIGPPEHTYPVTAFPPDALPDLRIAVVGDIGTGSSEEYETSAAMQDAARSDWYDALLLLGDNVYPQGEPDHLEDTVFRPFGPLLEGGTQLLAVLGNHDAAAEDGGAAQMEALGMEGPWWSLEVGEVIIVGLDSNRADDIEQLEWLGETLANTRATWRIAVLHHPPYSAGYQGSSTELRDTFVPLFERNGVQLVLTGHEHDYERSVPINGVTYVVSGAGAEFRRTGAEDYTAYSAATFHFVDVNVFDDRIYIQAIDNDGRMFDEVTILAP